MKLITLAKLHREPRSAEFIPATAVFSPAQLRCTRQQDSGSVLVYKVNSYYQNLHAEHTGVPGKFMSLKRDALSFTLIVSQAGMGL